jgi:hypothetical protein
MNHNNCDKRINAKHIPRLYVHLIIRFEHIKIYVDWVRRGPWVSLEV